MARELLWLRGIAEYVDGTASNGHRLRGPTLDPGWTLTRLRLSWIASVEPVPFPQYSTGLAIAFGAIVLPDPESGAGVPDPALDQVADWLWWEAGWTLPRAIRALDDTGIVQEADLSPPDPGVERDVRAQRKAPQPNGGALWFCSGATNTSPTQTRHYLSVAYSAGVLLPA